MKKIFVLIIMALGLMLSCSGLTYATDLSTNLVTDGDGNNLASSTTVSDYVYENWDDLENVVEADVYAPISPYASNPYLSGMLIVGIRGGGLTPAFNRATYAYTSTVPNSMASAQIQATAEDGESITVNGVSVQSGQPSQVINLQVGTNLVTVICNAATGSDFKKYEITITRAAT